MDTSLIESCISTITDDIYYLKDTVARISPKVDGMPWTSNYDVNNLDSLNVSNCLNSNGTTWFYGDIFIPDRNQNGQLVEVSEALCNLAKNQSPAAVQEIEERLSVIDSTLQEFIEIVKENRELIEENTRLRILLEETPA